MTSWQPGDRVALVRTDDPHTRLRPGDQGTVTLWNPGVGQLFIAWDSGSSLIMLPATATRSARWPAPTTRAPTRRPRSRRTQLGRRQGHPVPAQITAAVG